jgi:hypothetical protein
VDVDADSDADSDADTDGGTTGVRVLAETTVGPYETVVLDASDGGALTTWLQANGYTVPGTFADASAPYLLDGMNFLALRLEKDDAFGELRPLGVRWPGDRPSVPITLTSIAAVDGLPLTVFVLGDARAVPLSYLHVQPNPLVFDYFGQGRSWLTSVGLGADEAGGRAFATTYAGPTGAFGLYCADTAGLQLVVDPLEWFLALDDHGFTGTPELLEILRIHVPAPDGVDETAFYNAPASYPYDWAALAATLDAVAATQALQDRIVTPCTDADAAVRRNPYVTRLTSTISPSEMTVDPVFGFNPDLGDVSAVHEATLRYDCDTTEVWLDLEGGYSLAVTDRDDNELPTSGWVDRYLVHNALVIEQLSEAGPGEVVVDNRADLRSPAPGGFAGGEVTYAGSGACGCAGAPGVPLPVVLVAIGLVRRRMR